MRLIVSFCLMLLVFNLVPPISHASVSVSAQSAILMDQTTGRVLYEKNADNPELIASITKIMTAIIAIESGKLAEKVKISQNAIYTEGSSIYLQEGDQYTLEELVYGLMLRSGNDAAVAISEHVGESEEGFVYLMNEKARWLGMANTHFDNPHGLDSETHYSSAYDMALLMRYASQNEIFQEISSTKNYKPEGKHYSWTNKNKLLTQLYEHCTGGKTGFTKAAGRTLVTTAEKSGQTLIAVTIDAPSDWNDHISMFEYGFDHYPLQKIQEKGIFPWQVDDTETIQKGKIEEMVYYPLTNEELEQVESQTFLTENTLPFNKIGEKVFYLNGEKIAQVPIYEVEGANRGKEEKEGWIDRLFNMFQHSSGDKDG
ncbi:D-alanyl-D-alanine carboxypeptidase [Gracilibacillus halotolerans]|uniref:D-alanyl-D-alanine carboxypeptidase n=2 Tax=Gracilibacillus halotolerans TaxID=74386 RepID=A0A841RGE4_9BACI|nr:D-alanyl-D-alanine carboxypeptidase family protein [Gracilibacillus halotolerans]MBB6511691.1 D-alanyl-D-alanine carboxypeptidase [Gracilibacillus halotolerans]